jgi:hypothetical protein
MLVFLWKRARSLHLDKGLRRKLGSTERFFASVEDARLRRSMTPTERNGWLDTWDGVHTRDGVYFRIWENES